MVDGSIKKLVTGDFIICKYCDSGPDAHFFAAYRITKLEDGTTEIVDLRYFKSLETNGLFDTEKDAFAKVLEIHNRFGDIVIQI